MVGVAHGVELGDERRVPEAPERRGREERPLEAVRLPRLEDAPGRTRGLPVLLLVVAEIVEEALDPVGRAQPAREAKTRSAQDGRDSRRRREKRRFS